jgi:hypothetical protein
MLGLGGRIHLLTPYLYIKNVMLFEPTQCVEDIFSFNLFVSIMMIKNKIVFLFRNEQVEKQNRLERVSQEEHTHTHTQTDR